MAKQGSLYIFYKVNEDWECLSLLHPINTYTKIRDCYTEYFSRRLSSILNSINTSIYPNSTGHKFNDVNSILHHFTRVVNHLRPSDNATVQNWVCSKGVDFVKSQGGYGNL